MSGADRPRCEACPLKTCGRLGKVQADGRTYCEAYLEARSIAKASAATTPKAAIPRQAGSNPLAPIWMARACDYRLRLDLDERCGCGADAVCLLGKSRAADSTVTIGECIECVKASPPQPALAFALRASES